MSLSLQPRNVERIYCYYCEKNFDHIDKLLDHQRHSHARCPVCEATYSSVYVMLRHAWKAHKENLLAVPGAIPGRTSTAVDVVGMNGIPNCSGYLYSTTPKPRRKRAISYRPRSATASKDATSAHHLPRTRVAKNKRSTAARSQSKKKPKPKPPAPEPPAPEPPAPEASAPEARVPADASCTPSIPKTSIMALLNHDNPPTTDLN